jgi:virulence factor Mce-like protein
MQKRAPTLANMAVIAVFVLSCFGLVVYLWESFGGPLPLKPKGYQFRITFPEVLQLAEQADVRISGVTVGHVITFTKDKHGTTEATIQVNSAYAPVRANMHAILRLKSLVGETFLQLIPHGHTGPYIPDNGHLSNTQVEPTVTLDQILSLFTPKVRNDFRIWQQASAASFEGKGEAINADFASLQPFVESSNKLVSVLATQEGALRKVIKNTGVVFSALAGRDHQLEGLIVNGERTFKAAASASEAFAQTFRDLPEFERRSTVAFKELDNFAADATPFEKEFQAAERKLGPLSRTLKTFAPPFEKLLVGLGALTKASKKGLPAFDKSLKLLEPELGNLPPVLHNFDPFLQYLGQYQEDLQSFFANFTSATEAHGVNSDDPAPGVPQLHYLRTMQIINPEGLAVYKERIGTDRGNAYTLPGAFNSLGSGLPVFSAANCANSAPAVSGPPNETVSKEIIEQLIEYHVVNKPEATSNEVPAPACNQQGPQTFNGQSSQFPHVVYSGK